MPVIAAAAATAFAAVTTAASAAVAAAGLTFTGLNIATAISVVKVLSVASSIASLARKPKASLGSPSAIAFKADPNAGITFVAGEAAVGGNAVHADTHADKNRFLTYITALSHGGPVKRISQFTAADEVVTFTNDNGEGASGRYNNRMWQKFALGAIGAAALAFTSTANKYTPARAGNITTWNASHRLSGIAHTMWSMWSDTERYPNGVPKPLWVVWGGPVYDPRKDSTYPGGVGPQRWNDRTTWSLDGNENPQLQALTFLIGHYYNGVKMGGCGVPIRGIDVESYVQGANISDANGWRLSLPWNTLMRKWDVLSTMLQAGGSRPIARGSKISCVTSAPRVSIATITEADIAGDFSVTGSQARRERKNAIIPRLRDPSLKWSVQPFGEVTAAVYLAEDRGERRALEVDYEGIKGDDGGRQGRQIAAYDLTALREGLVATIPLKPWCRKFRAGDCLTIDAPETLMNGQKVIVIKRDIDPESLIVTLTVQSETDGKHAFALGQVDSPPPTPTLTGVDPLVLQPPTPEAWLLEPGTRPGGDDSEARPAPVIRVKPGPGDYDGIDDEPAATAVLIRYRVAGLNSDTGLPFAWSAPIVFSPSPNGYEITGLAPLTLYEVEIAYRARGVTSDWTPYGTVQTGESAATQIDFTSPTLKPILDSVGLVATAREDVFKAVGQTLDEVIERRKTGDNQRRASIARDEEVSGSVARLTETVSVQQGETLALIENTRVAVLSDLAAETSVREFQVSALGTSVAVIDQRSSTTATALAAETETRTLQISQTNNALAVVDQRSQTTANSLQSFSQTTTTQLSDFGTFKTTATQQLTTLATASSSQATSISLLSAAQGENATNILNVANALTTETETRGQQDAAITSNFNGQISSVNQQLVTLSNAQGSQATLIQQVQTTANGASATATLAIESLNGNAAYLAFNADVNNRITTFKVNGVTRSLDFLGDNFNVTSVNGGISYSASTKVFKIYGDGQMTLLKAAGGIRVWSGPESVGENNITEDNGVIALGPGVTGGGRFNGLTLSGFFDSGAPGGGEINLPKNTWTTVASVNRGMAAQGVIMSIANFGVRVTGSSGGSDDFGVLYRLAVANADGSNPVEIKANFGTYIANQWIDLTGVLLMGNVNIASRGEKRILLQINPTGANIATASARGGRVQGVYGA